MNQLPRWMFDDLLETGNNMGGDTAWKQMRNASVLMLI